ncbi:MAG: phenylacetate--CoA ligase family protein [Phycisphaerae bacterium]
MTYHVAEEESLNRGGLDALQRTKLAAMLEAILPDNAFYQQKFASISFNASRDPLSALPFTTRGEIQADQAAHPPYGSNLTFTIDDYCRLYQTSGTSGTPIRWLDGPRDWDWWKRCWGIIYRAAGVRRGDRFLFPFSFGPFIGFWVGFESAVALGNLCLPGGGMTTRARLRFGLENDVTFIGCTPTYALRMVEVATEEGIDLAASKVRGFIVGGEPGGSIPATRSRIETAWGARLFDHSGMTEIGPYGFECFEAPGGVHIMESEFIAEVIDPKTTEPVGEGEAGELVLTNLGRWGSPLIRYRTGDHVRVTRERCACGRWFARMEGGVLGRIDDMFIIRGNNVYPGAIEAILRRFADLVEYRVEVIEGSALAELRIEIEPASEADGLRLAEGVSTAIRDQLNFKPDVRVLEPGALPRFELKARRLVRRRVEAEDTPSD